MTRLCRFVALFPLQSPIVSMNRQFCVAFLPALADPDSISESDIVVTDVLRATTSIIATLANGATQVIPTPEIRSGIDLKKRLGPNSILGGERKGVIIPGYDQGNSPREYTCELVFGRTVILCTSNGTVAMESCRGARRVLIGAFVNLSAVAEALKTSERVTVVCAGTDRKLTSEDILFAGALAERMGHKLTDAKLDDSARIALAWWMSASRQFESGQSLTGLLGQSAGGRNLLKLKYDADVEFCARIDSIPVVPQLHLDEWSIRI